MKSLFANINVEKSKRYFNFNHCIEWTAPQLYPRMKIVRQELRENHFRFTDRKIVFKCLNNDA